MPLENSKEVTQNTANNTEQSKDLVRRARQEADRNKKSRLDALPSLHEALQGTSDVETRDKKDDTQQILEPVSRVDQLMSGSFDSIGRQLNSSLAKALQAQWEKEKEAKFLKETREQLERAKTHSDKNSEQKNWSEKVYVLGITTILPERATVPISDFIDKAKTLADQLHPFSDLIYTPYGGKPEKWITVVKGPIEIHSSLHPTGRDLPPEVVGRRTTLIADEGAKAMLGKRAIREDFRKEILSLTLLPPEQENQPPRLILQTGDTNYFTIRTLENMRVEAGRDNPDVVAKFFQNHWGMSTLVRAKDDNGKAVFIFSKRSGLVDFYPGCHNVTASGSMEKKDFFNNGEINLLQVATREVKEETGINFDPTCDKIEVLGLGYNPEKSDWNLQMYVRMEQSATEILANRDLAPDAWETESFTFVRSDKPETIIAYLKEQQGKWTPTGMSAIYNALCRDFGEEAIHSAWDKE